MRKKQMIDICLIFTPITEMLIERLEAPMGLLYIATYLNENGFEAEVRDLSGIALENAEIPPAKWYGFVTYSTTYGRTLRVKELALKINPTAKTIAGGPHASSLPKDVIKDFDYVVLDEAESAVLNLLRGETPPPAIVFDETPTGARTSTNPRIIQGTPIWDLDSIPFPDYTLVDIKSYKRVVDGKASVSLLSSRGCPFKCKFCNSKIMGGGTRLRYRSPQNVFDEMVDLRDKYGTTAFRFQDDIFGLDVRWLRKLSEKLRPLGITYRSFVRAHQLAKRGFAEELYASGCRHVALGIESGSDKILENMVKGQTVKTGMEGIKKAKEAGLIVRIYLIIGYPGETWDTVQETVDFVRDAKPDEFAMYPFIPYPGTPLYYAPEDHGIYNMDKDFTKYFQAYEYKKSHFVYDLADYDRIELQKMKDYVDAELEKIKIPWYIDANQKGFHV